MPIATTPSLESASRSNRSTMSQQPSTLPIHSFGSGVVGSAGESDSRPSTALLTAVECRSQAHLVVGCDSLAGARLTRCLDVGATVTVIFPPTSQAHYSVQRRIDEGSVKCIPSGFEPEHLTTLGREEVDFIVDTVFVTNSARKIEIARLCKKMRIPVNVSDDAGLSSFTLLATYTDGPLQVGVTTGSRGCKLSSRIKREIVSGLPKNLGNAVEILGRLRRKIWDEDHNAATTTIAATSASASTTEITKGDATVTTTATATATAGDDDDASDQSSDFNALVTPEDAEAAKSRRVRWLSQICEYWPLSKLCDLAENDVDTILKDYVREKKSPATSTTATSSSEIHQTAEIDTNIIVSKPGKISLVGSGPGNPELLTTASLKAIQSAELVLADKLIPSQVLDLVPRRAEVVIARKFPGNADKAQEELMETGLSALKRGLNVVRIKQGDPYIYGRGAEEVDFFRGHGYEPIVLPGVTSALSAPLFAGIPPTHRGVADQVLICTGTGRKGAAPEIPEYVSSRTTVFLMALHRINDLVKSLVEGDESLRRKWPENVPCAVIERASCPDQRVIRTDLRYVCSAIEELGSRPPGLLVVGWACNVLKSSDERWVVEERL